MMCRRRRKKVGEQRGEKSWKVGCGVDSLGSEV